LLCFKDILGFQTYSTTKSGYDTVIYYIYAYQLVNISVCYFHCVLFTTCCSCVADFMKSVQIANVQWLFGKRWSNVENWDLCSTEFLSFLFQTILIVKHKLLCPKLERYRTFLTPSLLSFCIPVQQTLHSLYK
jgi:hypothetical protein